MLFVVGATSCVWHCIVLCCFYVFLCISRSENHPFFIIVLTWSASLWLVVGKLAHSCQISIILFLCPPCEGLLLKWQCSASGLSSLAHVLHFYLWSLWFLMSSFMYLKREHPTFAGWWSVLPCWLSREHQPIMTPNPVDRVPRFVTLRLDILSWMVYCGYTRPSGCLWSSCLTQMWWRTVIVAVREQRVT